MIAFEKFIRELRELHEFITLATARKNYSECRCS
jgi:hypothetical protein